MYKITQADVIEWANCYEGDLFHALLADAPYEYGFMGKSWDATGISYRAETWAAYLHILYPGAFGMVFGGARTAHRIAVAIEDAGFIIHPMIGWVYGCLSEDTEILTTEGWMLYTQLSVGSMVWVAIVIPTVKRPWKYQRLCAWNCWGSSHCQDWEWIPHEQI